MELRIRNPFAFVLMPFDPSFTSAYRLVKQACDEAGVRCERVDEQSHLQNIVERIYEQIARADFVIADTTRANPNVFYEIGYARALNKRIIHITQQRDDVPFDLQQYRQIEYSLESAEGLQELKRDLKACFSEYLQPQTNLGEFASADAPFHIINKLSGKCVDVWCSSTENGVPILHYRLIGEENQIWTLHPTEGGFYRILARFSGKCLAVADNSETSGATVIQWDCFHDSPGQQWKLERTVDGSYRIKNRLSGKCLTIASDEDESNGGPLIQKDCRNDDNQRWWFMISMTPKT